MMKKHGFVRSLAGLLWCWRREENRPRSIRSYGSDQTSTRIERPTLAALPQVVLGAGQACTSKKSLSHQLNSATSTKPPRSSAGTLFQTDADDGTSPHFGDLQVETQILDVGASVAASHSSQRTEYDTGVPWKDETTRDPSRSHSQSAFDADVPSHVATEDNTQPAVYVPMKTSGLLKTLLHSKMAIGVSESDEYSFPPKVNVNSPSNQSASTLEDSLFNAQMESPKDETKYYIPADAQETLLTVSSIESELRRVGLQESNLRQLAETIFKLTPKLFGILVLLQTPHLIVGLLEEGVNDSDLPLRKSEGRLFGSHCIKTLTPRLIQGFKNLQWQFMVPVFMESEGIAHYKFVDNCILPFTKDMERSKETKVGGFGTVWEVVIHPAHQFLLKNNNSKSNPPSFALKRLHSISEHEFNLEVEMLKASSNHRHPHLVKLLATFEHQGRYYLLFPYAKANLRTYWENTPLPHFTYTTVLWLLKQCKGIASGLLRIHGYCTTEEYTLSTTQVGHPPGHANAYLNDDRLYGRHGDIKPENILWTDEDILDDHHQFCDEGLLLIADFGLMRVHTELTKSLIHPDTVTGSPTYEPPELKLHRRISRAYDIWSLGCVYLEFITWLVSGWQELDRFSPARSITGLDGLNDDTFYTVTEIKAVPNAEYRTAVVRDSVQQWVQDLHEQPRCSKFIHDFLHLIADHMLVINPADRILCGHLNERLAVMIRKAEENPNYLVEPGPYDRRQPETNSAQGLSSSRFDHRMSSPRPSDGHPLPKRTTIANGPAVLARTGPHSIGSRNWHNTSPPGSPKLE